jgi:hypothetical protein
MDLTEYFSEAEMIEMLAELDKYPSQTGDHQHEPSLPSLDDLAPQPSPSETERNLQQINLDRISGSSPQLEPHSNSRKRSPSLDSSVDLEEANSFLELISRDDSAPLPSSSETERNSSQINLDSNSVSGSPSAQSPQNLNEADTSPAIIHPQPEATQSYPLLADAETSPPPQDETTAAPHDEVAALLEMDDPELYASLWSFLPSQEQIESNVRAEATDNTFDAMATQSVSLPFPAPTDLLPHPTEVGVSSLELSNINFAMPLPQTDMAGGSGSPQNVSGPLDIVVPSPTDLLPHPTEVGVSSLELSNINFAMPLPQTEMASGSPQNVSGPGPLDIVVPAPTDLLPHPTEVGVSSLELSNINFATPLPQTEMASGSPQNVSGLLDIVVPAATDLLPHPTEVGVSSLELSSINFAMPLPPTEMAGGSPQNVSGPLDIVVPAPTDLLPHPTEVGVSSLELSNINFAMPLPPTEMAGGSPQNVSGPHDIVDQEMLGASDDGLDDPVGLLSERIATVSFSEYIPEIEMTDIIHPSMENTASPQSQDASDRASPDKKRSAKNGKRSGGQKRKARTILPPYYVRKSARRVDVNRYIRRRAILLLPKLSPSTSFTGSPRAAEKSPWATTSIQALPPPSPSGSPAPRRINEGTTGETRVEHVSASHETDALGLGFSEEAQPPKLERADEEWQTGVSNASTCDSDAQYVKGSDLDASQDIQIPAERADEEWQTGVSNTSTNTSTFDWDVQYVNNMKGSDLDASQDIQIPAERVDEEWQTGVSNTSMNTSTCDRDVQYINNMKGSDLDASQDIQIPAVEIGGGSTQMEKSSTCDASTQIDVLYVDEACQTESSDLDVSQDSQTPTVNVGEQPSTNNFTLSDLNVSQDIQTPTVNVGEQPSTNTPTPSDLDVSQDIQTPTENVGEQPSTNTPTPVRMEKARLTEKSPSTSQPHSTSEQVTRDKLMLEIALKHRPGKVVQRHNEPTQEEEDRSNDDKESERTRDKPSSRPGYWSNLWRQIDQQCPLPLAQELQHTGTHSHTETDANSEVAQRHDEPAQREEDLSPSLDDGEKSLRILERRSYRPREEYIWRSRPIDQIGPSLPLDKELSTDESSTEFQTMSDGAILKHERTLKVDASTQASWVPSDRDISSPDPHDPAGVRTEKTKRGKFFKLSSCLRDLAWLLIFFAMLLTLLFFLRERQLWIAADEIDYLRGHDFYYSEFYEQPPLFPWRVWSAVDSGENYI